MSTDPSFFADLDTSDTETMPPEPAPTVEPAPEPTAPAAAEQPVATEPAAAPSPVPTTIEAARDPSTGRFTEAPKVIPLAAHLEERARWKDERAALEERLAKLEKPAVPPAPEPDFIEDPKGYVDAKTERALAALKETQERLEPLQQAQETQQFLQTIASVEADYVKQAPDYYEALAHVRTVRAQQLMELYPQATPQQVQQQITSEELQVSRALLAQGRNPSEVVYKLAKTYGYSKPAPAPAPVVPQVPRAPVVDPSATLGPSGAASGDETVDEDEDEFTAALRERFKR